MWRSETRKKEEELRMNFGGFADALPFVSGRDRFSRAFATRSVSSFAECRCVGLGGLDEEKLSTASQSNVIPPDPSDILTDALIVFVSGSPFFLDANNFMDFIPFVLNTPVKQ
jgi:hypothetical protein